jgi:hypothetical protein
MRRITTKRKKELYSLSSLLLHLIIFICLLLSLGTDAEDPNPVKTKNADIKKEEVSPLKGFFASAKQ